METATGFKIKQDVLPVLLRLPGQRLGRTTGRRVVIDGLDGYVFIVHKEFQEGPVKEWLPTGNFTVTEASTGMRVVRLGARSMAETLRNTVKLINSVCGTREKFDQYIKDAPALNRGKGISVISLDTPK